MQSWSICSPIFYADTDPGFAFRLHMEDNYLLNVLNHCILRGPTFDGVSCMPPSLEIKLCMTSIGSTIVNQLNRLEITSWWHTEDSSDQSLVIHFRNLYTLHTLVCHCPARRLNKLDTSLVPSFKLNEQEFLHCYCCHQLIEETFLKWCQVWKQILAFSSWPFSPHKLNSL